MSPRQKIELRMSELREKIAGLNRAGDEQELTEEQLTERNALEEERQQLEPEWRKAMLQEESDALKAKAENTGENREIRTLTQRARLSNYVNAAAQLTAVSGVEAELGNALQLRSAQDGGVVVPWELLAPRVEQRADVDTTLPADAPNINNEPIIGRVFAATASAFLGVRMSGVGVGQQNIPVITAGTDPALKSAGAVQDATAATITADQLKPKRLTARYVIRREDMASLMGYEDALAADLRMALGEKLDDLVLNGDDATAPQWSGFFDALTDPTAPSALAYSNLLSAYGGGVDGKYALTLMDVRVLVGDTTYGKLAALVNTGSGETGVSYAQRATGGLQASALVPAASSNVQGAVLAKTGPGATDNSVVFTWAGVEIIRDMYSGAASGEVALTALSLVDFHLIRKDGYAQLGFFTG